MALENSINTNPGAFIALQNLNATNRALETIQTRVNTGLQVSSARDNSAIYAIAQNLRADVGGINAIQQSLGRADSAITTALNAGEAVSDLLVQLREIAVAASDTSLDANSRIALNNDFEKLAEQINSITAQAEFNGTNLLSDNPDSLSAIVSINSSGTVNTLNFAGTDITTDSNTAKTANAIVFESLGIQSLEDLTLGDTVLTTILEATDGTADFPDAAFANNAFDFSNFVGSFDNAATGGGDTLTIDIDFGDTVVQFQASGDFGDGALAEALDTNSVGFGALSLSDFKVVQVDSTAGDGSAFAAATTADVSVDASTYAGTFGGTDVTNATLSDVDLTVDVYRNIAIQVVDNYLQNVNSTLSTLGSAARQIDLQSTFASKLKDTVETGIGNLVDADLARESARLQALQVKQQLGIQALAIANASPQVLLALFR